jgi:ribosome-binding protein aMBF1 (putative translation factor)
MGNTMTSCEICGTQILDYGEKIYVEGNLITNPTKITTKISDTTNATNGTIATNATEKN